MATGVNLANREIQLADAPGSVDQEIREDRIADVPDSINPENREDQMAYSSSIVSQENRRNRMADAPSSSNQNRGDDSIVEIIELESGLGSYSESSMAKGSAITSRPAITSELAVYMLQKLITVSPSPFGKSCCIYRVHEKFRKTNEDAYKPELVSIGPFHHGNPALRAMQNHKLMYMNELLSRIGNPEAKLDECIEAIRRLEGQARECYSEPIGLSSDEFIEMMVFDGLFIIELFHKNVWDETANRDDDPIFNDTWRIASLARDMILLENQLPMFILHELFELTKRNPYSNIEELAIYFFGPMMRKEVEVLENDVNISCSHLLDLVSKTIHGSPKWKNSKNELKHVPCVTELRQAGVKFKKGGDSGSFLDIKFIDGVLEIPPLLIQDQTNSLLRNLVALELCCDGYDTYMTSYAFFMDNLIDSSNDVAFLCDKGIITNYLGENKNVSSLFNKLCSEVTLVNFYYSDLCDQLNAFHKTRWHVWKATLKRDYFKSPWSGISVFAAALLLLLTLTATVFAVLSFTLHKS